MLPPHPLMLIHWVLFAMIWKQIRIMTEWESSRHSFFLCIVCLLDENRLSKSLFYWLFTNDLQMLTTSSLWWTLITPTVRRTMFTALDEQGERPRQAQPTHFSHQPTWSRRVNWSTFSGKPSSRSTPSLSRWLRAPGACLEVLHSKT